MSRKTKIIIALLIGLALLVAILFAVVRGTGDKKANIIKILPDEADFRISDFVFTEVSQDDMRWEVKAASAQYQKKQNYALFDQVDIKLTTKDGKVYTMRGDQAEMMTKKKDVEIKGNVVVTSDTGEIFTTDYLRYSDTQKKIYTDAPVEMQNNRMIIKGVGLCIYIKKGELTLSSDVKAKIN